MIIMHVIQGTVRRGKGRGKDLGFPTANIALDTEIPEGIYLSKVQISTKEYPALTFIGVAKTFSENTYQAESYILDFNQSLYNKQITVYLLKKIRENQKFDSPEELITQMKEDELKAREYFKV